MEDGNVMIDILYEDNHLLVVSKPINVPVQSDISGDEDLLSILKKYLKDKYNKPGNVYLGLVHRLDRPVGGLMVFAKTSKAASRLSKEIRDKMFNKVYYAVVLGNIKNSDIFVDKLYNDRVRNISYVSDKGLVSKLSYEKIGYKDGFSLVRINLETGRSHQIRVQFSSRGFPLYGDQKYNKKAVKAPIALFAGKLEFVHPTTKEVMSFSLPLPDRYPFNLFK